MKIIVLINILKIILLSNLTASSAKVIHEYCSTEILCQYGGHFVNNSDYMFDKNDVLARCNIIVYGYYFLDGEFPNQNVEQADRDAIKSLVEDEQVVYIMVGFIDKKDEWDKVFYPSDQKAYIIMLDTFKTFLDEYKVGGFILDLPTIYTGNPDFADKVASFITEIVTNTGIEASLIVNGKDYKNFEDVGLFDFATTNSLVKHYIIDTTTVNECKPEENLENGIVPIMSPDPNVFTLANMGDATFNSEMDMCKIYVRIAIGVTNEKRETLSYSEYCSVDDNNYCVDSLSSIYEKGAFSRQIFLGMMLSEGPGDDSSCYCKCQKFPLMNTILDGWDLISFQGCAETDEC